MHNITKILSDYIASRTAFLKHTNAVFIRPNTTREVTTFDMMVNSYHQMLAQELPAMNVAELEALSELVSSRLAYIRMHKI